MITNSFLPHSPTTRRTKKGLSSSSNNNEKLLEEASKAPTKTLKQLSLVILQFGVFNSQFLHLIYLTLSRVSHAFLNSLFISFCVDHHHSFNFSSFRGLIFCAIWLPSDWITNDGARGGVGSLAEVGIAITKLYLSYQCALLMLRPPARINHNFFPRRPKFFFFSSDFIQQLQHIHTYLDVLQSANIQWIHFDVIEIFKRLTKAIAWPFLREKITSAIRFQILNRNWTSSCEKK